MIRELLTGLVVAGLIYLSPQTTAAICGVLAAALAAAALGRVATRMIAGNAGT